MDEKNVLDFEALEAAVNADAEAATDAAFAEMGVAEVALAAEEPKPVVRVDAVAVPLPLEPIVLTGLIKEAVVEVVKDKGMVEIVDTTAEASSVEPVVLDEVGAFPTKKPYTPRSHKRVVFDIGMAMTTILNRRPTTVNESAKICFEQLAPGQMATAYGKSKKILAGLVTSGGLTIGEDKKTLTWLS